MLVAGGRILFRWAAASAPRAAGTTRAVPGPQPTATLCLPSSRLGLAGGWHNMPSHSGHLPALLLHPSGAYRRRRTASHQPQGAGPLDALSGSSTDDYSEGEQLEAHAGRAGQAAGSAASGIHTTAAPSTIIGMPAREQQGAHDGGGSGGGALGFSSGAGSVVASTDEEGRWHDAMHKAIIGSLQPPLRAGHPSWWGKRFHGLQRRMAEVLESREAHYVVIGMVLLDLAIVLTELVLSSFYPSPELAPHIVHVAEEALSYTSIGILACFNAELLAKLLVFGVRYFTNSNWHMFDAVVVVTSFTLELSLRGVAQEVASLLIFFRLWRIMRIMHGVAEAMELNHSQELQKLHSHNQQLETELSVSQQRLQELQQQVALLNVAAAAKGLDLHLILSTAASQQQQLAAAAQQQLLAAAAATASKGLELHSILAAAAAQQQLVAASAQQQLLAAAAAAAVNAPALASTSASDSGSPTPLLLGNDAAAAAVAAALAKSHRVEGHSQAQHGGGSTHVEAAPDAGENGSGGKSGRRAGKD